MFQTLIFMILLWLGTVQRTSILMLTKSYFINEVTVNHYNFNKSNGFVLFLDATKAFNRVRYCKLFKKLIKRNVSIVVLCLLLDMYTSQTLRVNGRILYLMILMYVMVLSRVGCSLQCYLLYIWMAC